MRITQQYKSLDRSKYKSPSKSLHSTTVTSNLIIENSDQIKMHMTLNARFLYKFLEEISHQGVEGHSRKSLTVVKWVGRKLPRKQRKSNLNQT